MVVPLVPKIKIAEEESPQARDEENKKTTRHHALDICKGNARRKIVSIIILLFVISFQRVNVIAIPVISCMLLKKSHLNALQALRAEAMLG